LAVDPVDKQVARGLRAADPMALRVFVASCAERMAPLYGVIHPDEPGTAYVVESLDLVWDLRLVPDSFHDRAEVLRGLPELAEVDDWISDSDTVGGYAAAAALLAVESTVTGTAKRAEECAGTVRAGWSLIGNAVPGSSYWDDEGARQVEVTELLSQADPGTVAPQIRETDREISRQRLAAILPTINRA
jgi:hypothetical protein